MTDPQPTAGVVDALSCYLVAGDVQANGVTDTSGAQSPKQWLMDILGGPQSSSGIHVDRQAAMSYPPVWYAVQKIAGHLGMMSLGLYVKTGPRKKRPATEHPAYRLRKEPNHLMTGSVFRETLTGHAVFRGNGRALIERDVFARPLRLIPLLPDTTVTVLVNDEKWHVTRVLDDAGQERVYRIHDGDVLHVPGFGYDGLVGYDVLQLARESIGLGLAAERQQARHYGRNAVPGIILEAPREVIRTADEARDFLRVFREAHEGVDNAGKTAMLRNGITAKTLGHTARDSQTKEMRLIQRQDAALWFALESILGDDSSVSYNSEEQKQLAYLMGAIGKLANKWEEELDRKLLTEPEKLAESHYHKLNSGSLLRADMKTTMETLEIAVRSTIYSRNDARAYLGEDEVEGGDEYVNPNTTAETAAKLRDRLQAVIAGRLQDLLDVEAARIRKAAQNPDTFAGWAERFYSSGNWPDTWARAWESFGGSPEAAASLVRTHRRDLEATVRNLPDITAGGGTLASAVESLIAAWSEYIKTLAAELASDNT